MIGLFPLLLIPVLGQASGPDAAALLRRAVDAERDNRHKAGNYLFREVIFYREGLPGKAMNLRRSAAYEVTFLEGEPFHRLVELDGAPLSPEMERNEQKRMEEVAEYRRKVPLEKRRKKVIAAEGRRFRIDLRLIGEYHEAHFAGEDTVLGRKAWIIETEPKPGTHKPRNRAEWALSQKCRYWIDQETMHPLKLVSTQLYDWDDVSQGTVTESTWLRVDDVWLVATIKTRGEEQRGKLALARETDQRYSNYRKFSTTSAITYEAER